MAKVDTDAQAQAVQTLLSGLSLKRKQELVDRNDRLRMQFMHTQKMAAAKAREPQLNSFLSSVVTKDGKVRELVFNAWVKDNAQALGDVPEFPERFKRDAEVEDEEGLEADIKDASASMRKWVKAVDPDMVQAYGRLGPYEFPSKVLTAAKRAKPKETTAAGEDETAEAVEAAAAGASEAAIAEMRQEMETLKANYEAKIAKQEDEVAKFKRLLEENKDKRKAELNEAQDKARQELQAKQADWQRQEASLKKELSDLQKSQRDQQEKTSKVRDELVPMKQQLEKAEKEARRAQGRYQELADEISKLEEEKAALADRIKVLEGSQAQLVNLEKQLQKFQKKGASVALASTDNLKVWEEALAEQEVKDALKRTFNLDTIGVSQYEHDAQDLHQIWLQLIAQESDLVERFFALPFDELYQPTDEFKELITSFIELKDSLVAREQLAHLLNFVGNKFLTSFKQKV